MRGLAQRVRRVSNAEIDAEVAAFQQRTLEAQRRLFWQSTLLVPLTLFAILV